jgi:NlpC/P60 family putative phage cell wall peptidase
MTRDVKRPIGELIVAEALTWVGTPYRHQGSQRGVGCDCLGLVRGVWLSIYGREAERPGPYAPDWAEANGGDALLDAARRHCREKACVDMQPGDLLVFRWRADAPAKHAGILVAANRFIHAYQGHAVLVSALAPQWARRIAGVFEFPSSLTQGS